MPAAMSWALTRMGHKRGAEQAGMLDEADSAAEPTSGQMIYRGPARTSGVGRSHFVYHVRRDALLIVRVGASGTQRRAGFSRVDSSERQHVVPARGGGCLPDVPHRLVWKSEARAIRRRFEVPERRTRLPPEAVRSTRSMRPQAAPYRTRADPTSQAQAVEGRPAQAEAAARWAEAPRAEARRMAATAAARAAGAARTPAIGLNTPPGLRGIPKGQRHAGVRRRLQVGVGRVR